MSYFLTFDASRALEHRLIEGLHAIPKDAVEVDAEVWSRITQETDGVWTLSADGSVVKKAFEIDPEMQAARLIEVARVWRDAEIARVAWLRDRHRDELELGGATSITPEQYTELLEYIQQLRDWPAAREFPADDSRPDLPGWTASQTE